MNMTFHPLNGPKSRTSRFCCFDVFDTLLTRAVGNPEHVFLLLGRRLLLAGHIRCSAEVFARQRVQAEERANHIRSAHSTLEEIYKELIASLNAQPEDLALLMEAEFTIERELSRAIPTAYALVQAARRAGERVVFITDTNMPSNFIRELLASKSLYEPEDVIFASCECRVDKARGLLYTHISQRLEVSTRALRHHGNDAVADFRNGRLSGWKVSHLTGGNLNRYERAVAADGYATGGLSSLLSGAARLARLTASAEERRTIPAVSAGVAAPSLVAWVIWLMRKAVREGCRRLYFVSRDGEVVLEIARRLESVLCTGLDLRYLFTSRRILQRCGPLDVAMRELLRPQSCRMMEVAEFLNIDVDTLAAMLPEHLSNPLEWNRNLSAEDRKHVFRLIQDNESRVILAEKAAEARNLYLEYLFQEGWQDGTTFGLVDVGWRASIAGTLSSILSETSIDEPHRYYFFGLSSEAYRVAGPGNVERLRAWLFDGSAGSGYLPELQAISTLIEMFCAGEHGAVIGLHWRGDRIEPVLASETSPMQEWGLASIRQTIYAFTDIFVETLHSTMDLIDMDADVRRGVNQVLRLFWLHPTVDEVREWGTFPVETTLNNSLVKTLAERVGFHELWTACRNRKFCIRSEHGWGKGTAVQSRWPIRVLLTTAWRVRDEIPRFRRRLKWLKGRLNLQTA